MKDDGASSVYKSTSTYLMDQTGKGAREPQEACDWSMAFAWRFPREVQLDAWKTAVSSTAQG